MLLDGGAYVAKARPRLSHPHADVPAFARHLHETLPLGADLADEEHARGVGEVALVDGGHVHVDDVAIVQVFARAGDAVAHHVVDADAHALGESLVEEGGGDGIVVGGEAVDQVVHVGRGHAFADVRGHIVQQGSIDFGALADAGQLFGGAEQVALGQADAGQLFGGAEQVALGQADAFFLEFLYPGFHLVGVSLGREALGVYELLHAFPFLINGCKMACKGKVFLFKLFCPAAGLYYLCARL